MSNNQVPCKDCVTLPICVSVYMEELFYFSILPKLISKCSLLNDYLWPSKTHRHRNKLEVYFQRSDKIRVYFNETKRKQQ
jgi:hypothetical protein